MAMTIWAQQDRGTFTGTVTDATGAAVPNVKVRAVHAGTNARYGTQTNGIGQYRIPNLPIGTYRITFEAAGFKTAVNEDITLNVVQVQRVDAQMQVGSAAESVDVTAAAPLLNTETPEVGTVLNNRTVTDLPLGFSGGRYAENFAYALTPGVAGNNWESRINGSPSFSKAVVLDGADASIYITGHMGESSPSMEALEEFKVQTSGMSAEFGRTGGGVFNFVMKSGTNKVHGSALGLIHNEWADANSFANNFYGRPRRMDRRHDYGGSFGGPVWIPKVYNGKDKTFFYVAYERYKEAFGGSGSPNVTVPLEEFYAGNLSRMLTNQVIGQDALGRTVLRGQIYDPTTTRTVNGNIVRDPFPGNLIPADRISRVARNLSNIMRAHYLPQVRDASGQIALLNNSFFPVSNQAGFTQDQFSIKGDHFLSAAHKISGSFVRIDRPRNLLDSGGVWDFSDPLGGPLSRARIQQVQTWYGRAAYDWTVSSTMLNHLTLGFNRQRNPSISRHIGEGGGGQLGITGIDPNGNFPEISLGSNDRFNFPVLGYNTNDVLIGTNYQLIDTYSWIYGRHSVRFGIDYRRTYMAARSNTGPGRFNFTNDITGLPSFNQTGNGFASMLLGEVTSASVPVNTPTMSKFHNFALFAQDDFKVTRRLTLNIGVRWDYQPLPTEQYDRLHNFNPTLIDPVSGLPGATEYAGQGPGRSGKRTFGNNSWTDFSPRFGFAWQTSSRTAVRGGYGIFYSARNPQGWSGVPWGNTFGFTSINTVNRAPGNVGAFNWDRGYPGVTTSVPPDPSLANYTWGVVSYDPNAGKVGYTQQWNVNIQRELPAQMVFDIGYIGSKSTGILANELRNINQIPVAALSLGDVLGQYVSSQAQIPPVAAALGARYPFGNTGQSIPVQQTLQPFPQVPYWSSILSACTPLGFSTYHALQVQLNKRYSEGFQFLANYTFSKALDNLNSAFGDTWGMNSGRPIDYNNLSLDKSVSAFDRSHWVKIGASYDVPFGRGRRMGNHMSRAVDMAAGGWTLQYIGNYSSGEPIGFGATGTPNSNFATNRPVIVNPNGQSLAASSFNADNFDMSRINTAGTSSNQYINTSLVRDPSRYERGNAPYRLSQLRGFAFYNEDFSLQKNFRPVESIRIQFRAEALNLLNRHRFEGINTNPASPLFGQITGVSDDRRQIQFGIRADF